MPTTVLFPNYVPRWKTKDSPLAPVALDPAAINYNGLTQNNTIVIRAYAVAADVSQGQPEAKWALPDLSSMTVGGVIKDEYAKLSQLAANGSVDAAVSIALKPISEAIKGINQLTGQPTAGWGNVYKEIVLQPVSPSNPGTGLTLKASNGFFLDVVAEVPVAWYPISIYNGGTAPDATI